MSELPKGRRFTHLYRSRPEPVDDSRKARARIASYTEKFGALGEMALGTALRVELGSSETYAKDFLVKASLDDFLDSITILHEGIADERSPTAAANFRDFVGRVFSEENLRYVVDDEAGVHHLVDPIFEEEVGSTLFGLSGPRYANSRTEMERGLAALDERPPNGKAAVHGVFSAVENLFKLLFPSAPRLAAGEIDSHLEPRAKAHLGDDKVAARSTQKVLASFKDWVEAAHFYRHAPGTEEVRQPPDDLVVLLVSQGLSYLRWLASIDAN